MWGKWSLGQFSLSEGNTLYENLTIHIENRGNLERYNIHTFAEKVEINTSVAALDASAHREY